MLADTFPTFKVAVVCDNMDEKSHKRNIQAKKKMIPTLHKNQK